MLVSLINFVVKEFPGFIIPTIIYSSGDDFDLAVDSKGLIEKANFLIWTFHFIIILLIQLLINLISLMTDFMLEDVVLLMGTNH